MELRRIYSEFESEELAELAAGRIRRAVRGIRRMTVYRVSRSHRPVEGKVRYTILPANPRMMNYATDVMLSDMAQPVPEPVLRREAELMIVCDETAIGRISALLHAAGAMRVRNG